MSSEKSSDNNANNSAEKNLMTLDQLSQTIEVMTSVVNRLKRHLNMQLLHNTALSGRQTDQTIELSRELLDNERELQELQQIADQQRNAVLGSVLGNTDSPHNSPQDDQDMLVKREGFIVEISRLEEGSDQDRILH
ncbi:MAG: hypothetical protein Q8L60_04570 [Gammaproteobacteria bacterium]|nr:hypothetical protein [Gammaproteobacteria bacterium]MDP2140412.1 hypothetical protein [Gammaproteobacteria bacterium]MDP2349451.1 hypothetical protein [Gammaproteobacteria bacterium]